jgi:DeoR family glycerol-3-phosphate regulon repressor
MELNPRQSELIEAVKRHGVLSIEALAERFSVTLQTVRRDVHKLSEAGLLARYHGGVRTPGSTTENIAYRQRQALQAAAKLSIANAVAKRIPNGCSLLMNIGTTTEAVAHALLNHKDLRIITNNIHIATLMSANPSCELILAGGLVRSGDQGIFGEATVDFISQFKVDIGIVGTSSIENDGTLRDFDFREVKVTQTIMKRSREVWMVADHSKFNRPAMVEVGSLKDLDILFTDQVPPVSFVELMQNEGVECAITSEHVI